MNRLKELRIKREFHQLDVAKRTGLKLGTIQKWEQDKNDLCKASVDNVYKLAKVFDVSIEYLVGYSNIR